MMAPPSAIVGILSCLVHSRLACFLTGFAAGFALCLGAIIVVKRRKRHQVFVAEIPSLDTASMAPTLRLRPSPSRNDGDDESITGRKDSPPPPASPPRTPPRYADAEPHPTHGFRVVRCTIGLVNPHTMALGTQNIELCFHDDFVASEHRPLSLHLDHRHLSIYDRPPLLTAPPPPGAIFDLGRVDVIPDDPGLMILLERQIRRELAEEMQRRAQEAQPITQRAMHLAHVGGNFVEANRSNIVMILRLLLGGLMLTLIPYAYLSKTSEPTTSPVPLVPLVDYITSAVLDTTQLTPSIFFSPFIYATITNGSSSSTDNPEQVISKMHILDETWNMTDHLFWDFLHKSFSAEEFRRYTASDQSSTASRRLLTSDLWEYAGIRWRDVQETWARGKMIHSRARWDWFGISTDVFVSWTHHMDMSIRSAATYLEFVDVTPASSLFIAPETCSPNATTCPGNLIARAALPKDIPSEVRDILDTYRDYMARLDFLSSSCKVLQDCTAPLPDSAPSHQVVHPSCQLCRAGDCSPEAMIKNLEEWSVTARARNLPWRDLTESERWRQEPRMAEYFWPNKTEFPLLFNQAMILAQLKDAMNQVAETVEVIKHANQKTQDKNIFARMKCWTKGEQVLPDPEDDIKELKEMLQVRFWHQLRDVVQGIQAVSGICGELSTLLSLVNMLYSPANWIIEEGKSTVMLQKMAHPKDQAKALNNLRQEIDRRLGVLDRYYQLWARVEGEQDKEEQYIEPVNE